PHRPRRGPEQQGQPRQLEEQGPGVVSQQGLRIIQVGVAVLVAADEFLHAGQVADDVIPPELLAAVPQDRPDDGGQDGAGHGQAGQAARGAAPDVGVTAATPKPEQEEQGEQGGHPGQVNQHQGAGEDQPGGGGADGQGPGPRQEYAGAQHGA